MAKTLYSEKTLIGRLQQYFLIYFETFFCSDSRYLISADIIYTDLRIRTFHPVSVSAFLYGIMERSLNAFYYACFYAKVDYSIFMNTTVRIALKLIPDSLQT